MSNDLTEPLAAPMRLETIGGTDLQINPRHLVVAGYTGRDRRAVQHHIDELAAIGVPEPDSVPAFYEMPLDRLTLGPDIEVDGSNTSGEVEPVLIRAEGCYFLTLGSDHTDRDLERVDIRASKAACPKPIGSTAIDLGADPTAVAWDEITARSWVDGDLYQEGPLAQMMPTGEVLAEWERAGVGGVSLVLFGGTMPLINGVFRAGEDWRMTLDVPGQPTLELNYHVTVRSI